MKNKSAMKTKNTTYLNPFSLSTKPTGILYLCSFSLGKRKKLRMCYVAKAINIFIFINTAVVLFQDISCLLTTPFIKTTNVPTFLVPKPLNCYLPIINNNTTPTPNLNTSSGAAPPPSPLPQIDESGAIPNRPQ